MRLKLAGAAAVAAMLVLTGCATSDAEDTETTATAEETTDTGMDEGTDDGAAEDEPGTIVDVAAGNEDFETLVAAVQAAGLAETLSGEGPFTVFAPTDAAFEALPEGLLDALLLPENKDALTSILTYHALGDEVTSDEVTAGDVTTLEGSTIAVTTDGGVKVNDANVVATDVAASNGVIHVIDAVLVPPTVDPAALLQ